MPASAWSAVRLVMLLGTLLVAGAVVAAGGESAGGLPAEAVTLLKGVQHRAELLSAVDMTVCYEMLTGPKEMRLVRQGFSDAGDTDRADRMSPYDRAPVRVVCSGDRYRVEIRATNRSGQVVWFEEVRRPQWELQPPAHQIHVVETYDGETYSHYSAADNTLLRSSDGRLLRFRADGTGWRQRIPGLVSPQTLAKLLGGECTGVSVSPDPDGSFLLRATLTYGRGKDQDKAPTCDLKLRISPELGYAVTGNQGTVMWGEERTPGSGDLRTARESRKVANGVYVPSIVEHDRYVFGPAGELRWSGSHRYQMRSFRLLPLDDRSAFVLDPPVGVRLIDRDTGMQTRVGAEAAPPFAGSDLPLGPPDASVAEVLAPPGLTRGTPAADRGGGRTRSARDTGVAG